MCYSWVYQLVFFLVSFGSVKKCLHDSMINELRQTVIVICFWYQTRFPFNVDIFIYICINFLWTLISGIIFNKNYTMYFSPYKWMFVCKLYLNRHRRVKPTVCWQPTLHIVSYTDRTVTCRVSSGRSVECLMCFLRFTNLDDLWFTRCFLALILSPDNCSANVYPSFHYFAWFWSSFFLGFLSVVLLIFPLEFFLHIFLT